LKLKYLGKKKEAEGVYSFIFEKPKDFSFQAGQYLFYTLPNPRPDNRGITRYFTISAAPSEDILMLTTRIADEPSTFKKSLMALDAEETIEASGPDGRFVVENPNRPLIFVAGGIGITPFRSILKEFSLKGMKPNVQLLYANRDNNTVYNEEFDSLKKLNPNFSVEYFISPHHIDEKIINFQLSPASPGEAGRANLTSPLIYISGPNSFTRAIRDIVLATGFSKENLVLDYFPGYSEMT
jgi:ferredoxin-NADP reductase